MPAINSDNVEAWRELARDLSVDRPSVGKTVTVDKGKHKGKTGIVERHQLDKFVDAYRYANEASAHFRDMAGRYGWICLVKTSSEKFWVKADSVTCQA